jgi:hypothetical protein
VDVDLGRRVSQEFLGGCFWETIKRVRPIGTHSEVALKFPLVLPWYRLGYVAFAEKVLTTVSCFLLFPRSVLFQLGLLPLATYQKASAFRIRLFFWL